MLAGGRYRLLRRIGRGGQAEVHEAVDQETGAHVAIKLLRPEAAADRAALERLRREVLLASRITHPNVARVHDFQAHLDAAGRQVAFIVMELLVGETLHRRRLRQVRLSAAESFPLVAQIAVALTAAHRQNIIHRDLKPSNVMLVPHGAGGERVVVTDFGLARPIEKEDLRTLTATGEAVGTPQYMAPEQVRGAPALTQAADIYALGVVMFELVTGHLPFGDDPGMAAQLEKLLEPAPPARRWVPDLPRPWNDAIARCLEIVPTDRFSSAGELVDALRGRPASARKKGRGLLGRLRESARKP